MTAPYAGPEPVLLLTRDAALVDVLRRLAVAAGAELAVHADPPGRAAWLAAEVVLVGADLAEAVAAVLPRRPGVVLAALGPAEASPDGEAWVWRLAVAVGAERVARLPEEQEQVVHALAGALDAGRRSLMVAVVGGCGGAGASVLATAVAVRAAGQGRRVLLADLDPLGGGIDLLVGAEGVPGLRWPDLAHARGRVSGGMLREALPRIDGLSVLTWARRDSAPVPAAAVAAIAAGALRGFDLVVADLPRARDPVLVEWLRRVELALVVAPAAARAVAASQLVAAGLSAAVEDVRLVLRVGPRSGPTRLSAAAAELCGCPVLHELRDEPGLEAALARGEPPGLRRRGPLARCADQILAAVQSREPAA